MQLTDEFGELAAQRYSFEDDSWEQAAASTLVLKPKRTIFYVHGNRVEP